MQKYFFLFLHQICALGSFGQVDILNTSLIDAREKVLIRGFYNQLEVVGMEVDSTFEFTTNKGDNLEKSGNYLIFNGGSDSISVVSIVKNGRVYFTTTFKVLKYNDPKVYLGNLRDSLVTKEELLKNLYLHLSHEPIPLKVCSTVRLEESKIMKSNGKIIDLYPEKETRFDKRMNALIADENWEKAEKLQNRHLYKNEDPSVVNQSFNFFQMKHIKKLKKGDVLWIQMCHLSCPSCVSRKYGANLKFRII